MIDDLFLGNHGIIRSGESWPTLGHSKNGDPVENDPVDDLPMNNSDFLLVGSSHESFRWVSSP